MKYSQRLLSLLFVGVLGLASLSALTYAWGHSSDDKRSWHGKSSQCERGRHGSTHYKHRMHRSHGHRMHGSHGPNRFAMRLSALETEIGIRANQLDAWRDFTDALLAIVKRPSRGAWLARGDQKAEPFALAQRLADNAIARAKAGEDLAKAIQTLRTTLTPEQLDKVSEIEARVRRGHFGSRGHSAAPKVEQEEDQSEDPTPETPEDDDSAPSEE